MNARGALAALMIAGAVLCGPTPAAAGEARAAGPYWHTDYAKAAARAARSGKPLLLYFTGSDWCDWCRTLATEVFDSPAFADWARRTVVLVEVDFPRYAPQRAGLRRQNRRLAKRFAALLGDGYPTVVFLDPTGARVLGDLGYVAGGPGAWTEAAEAVLRGPR